MEPSKNGKNPQLRRTQEASNDQPYSNSVRSFKVLGRAKASKSERANRTVRTQANFNHPHSFVGGIIDQLIKTELDQLAEYERGAENVRERIAELEALKRLSTQVEQLK